jgi:hypothetical protein
VEDSDRVTRSQPAFPKDKYSPARLLKRHNGGAVTTYIFSEFCFPEFDIAGRLRSILASLMPMPVTPVDEYHRAMSWKNKIRSTGKRPVMQPIAKSLTMQEAPNQHFRPCVLAANTGHHSRSDLRSHNVYHGRHYSSTSLKLSSLYVYPL